MAIEHEFKFVLDMGLLDSPAFARLKEEWWGFEIEQGYLTCMDGMSARVRRTCDKWEFTFKQKVNNRVIELEQQLFEDEGRDLWTICSRKLKKTRYSSEGISGGDWVVDVFKDAQGEPYFVMAEVELEEGSECPPVLDILEQFVIYRVPLTDERFSSKNLSNIKHVRHLYEEVRREHHGA